jgi:hypothetical protein
VVYDGLEWGDDPEVQGERCPECSSPDARTYRILYDDKPPVARTNDWKRRGKMSDQKHNQSSAKQGQCIAQSKATGQRCKGKALPESMFCFSHDPRLSERRAEGSFRGEKNRAHVVRAGRLVPPRLLSVYDQLELALTDVRSGKLDPRVAGAMAALARAMVSVVQAGESEQRLRDLEALVSEQLPDARWKPMRWKEQVVTEKIDLNSPEGILRYKQQIYDQKWDAWFGNRDSQFRRDELEQAEKELNEAKLHVERNNAAKREWEAKLKAEQDAKQAESEARLEAELEPSKQREMRAWLIAHPDKDQKDFEQKAWPLIRQNLAEDRQQLLRKAAEERARCAGQEKNERSSELLGPILVDELLRLEEVRLLLAGKDHPGRRGPAPGRTDPLPRKDNPKESRHESARVPILYRWDAIDSNLAGNIQRVEQLPPEPVPLDTNDGGGDGQFLVLSFCREGAIIRVLGSLGVCVASAKAHGFPFAFHSRGDPSANPCHLPTP